MRMQAGVMALMLVGGAAWAESAAVAPVSPSGAAASAGMSEGARLGYTLGFTLGQRVGADIKNLDIDSFNGGFRHAYQGAPGTLSADEMQQVIADFQASRLAAMQAEADKLASDNLAAAKVFLAKNGRQKGVKTTASGLQYKVLKKGRGASPQESDMVTAHYHGTLPDGTVFDSSRDGEPVEFPLNRVIPGWTEALQLMNKGAKFQLFIPPQLGYGESGAGDIIGPNQALVFEVELVGFGPMPVDQVIQPLSDDE